MYILKTCTLLNLEWHTQYISEWAIFCSLGIYQWFQIEKLHRPRVWECWLNMLTFNIRTEGYKQLYIQANVIIVPWCHGLYAEWSVICIVPQAELSWCTSKKKFIRKRVGTLMKQAGFTSFVHLHSFSSHHAGYSLLCSGEFDLYLHALFISYLLTPKGVVILQT